MRGRRDGVGGRRGEVREKPLIRMIADVLRRADGTNKRAEDGVDVGGRRPIVRLLPISPPLPAGRGASNGFCQSPPLRSQADRC